MLIFVWIIFWNWLIRFSIFFQLFAFLRNLKILDRIKSESEHGKRSNVVAGNHHMIGAVFGLFINVKASFAQFFIFNSFPCFVDRFESQLCTFFIILVFIGMHLGNYKIGLLLYRLHYYPDYYTSKNYKIMYQKR